MVNWVLRGAVLLWALLFFIVGIRGVLNPASFTETFGIIADGVAANTVRADMSAFFLVAAGGAAIGGLLRGWSRALLVPAALYGTALVGRLIGVASGDPVSYTHLDVYKRQGEQYVEAGLRQARRIGRMRKVGGKQVHAACLARAA